jgi:hypothetical protein
MHLAARCSAELCGGACDEHKFFGTPAMRMILATSCASSNGPTPNSGTTIMPPLVQRRNAPESL